MQPFLIITLAGMIAASSVGPAAADSTAYYRHNNHYSSNCDTPSNAC